jgi:hypothetical protein
MGRMGACNARGGRISEGVSRGAELCALGSVRAFRGAKSRVERILLPVIKCILYYYDFDVLYAAQGSVLFRGEQRAGGALWSFSLFCG